MLHECMEKKKKYVLLPKCINTDLECDRPQYVFMCIKTNSHIFDTILQATVQTLDSDDFCR